MYLKAAPKYCRKWSISLICLLLSSELVTLFLYTDYHDQYANSCFLLEGQAWEMTVGHQFVASIDHCSHHCSFRIRIALFLYITQSGNSSVLGYLGTFNDSAELLHVPSDLFICLFVWLRKGQNLHFVIFWMGLTFEMLVNSNPSYCLFFSSKILSKLNISRNRWMIILKCRLFWWKPIRSTLEAQCAYSVWPTAVLNNNVFEK